MRVGWTIAAAMAGMLILGVPLARADDDAGGGDTRALVQGIAYEAGASLNRAHGPGGPGGGPPHHDDRGGRNRRDQRDHQRLGSYPFWFRYHHRYGYDYPRRHPFGLYGRYPYSRYGVYLSAPWGAVGYWQNGTYYGYVPFDYSDAPVVYRPYSGRYIGGDAYNEYIILDTPTVPAVPAPAPAAQQAPPAPERGAEAERYESPLSVMLGGADRVGLAFALGEASLKAGQASEAVTAFRQALRGDPGASSVRLALALALAAEGDHTGAAQMIRLGLGAVAKPDALLVDGPEVFGSVKALDALVGELRDATEQEKGADAQLVLGFVCFATGRLGTARDALWAAYDAEGGNLTVGRLLLAAERRLRAEPPAAGGTSDEALAQE